MTSTDNPTRGKDAARGNGGIMKDWKTVVGDVDFTTVFSSKLADVNKVRSRLIGDNQEVVIVRASRSDVESQ